jgi:branched-chain amino acid transport system substrate-binding protein
VYKAGKGTTEASRIGTVSYNRGVITGIIIVEAMRNAIKAGGAPLDGKKVRDGYRLIKLDDKRLAELGAKGLMPQLIFSAKNHGGLDAQVFQVWDGKDFKTISGWIQPNEEMVMAKVRASAQAYRDQVKTGAAPK